MSQQNIRNICIIAHVDHGKTTLVDYLLKQAGTFQAHEQVEERLLDSQDQEKERGITIAAKNAAFRLGDLKVNIVDTPGHADFGGEVERIMGLVDSAILLVDAMEGPLPQTRFVLEKAIAQNLNIALCINKVDRSEIQGTDLIDQTVDKVFDLFVELGASEAQLDFPIVYACARDGWCTTQSADIEEILAGQKQADLSDLFEIIKNFPEPSVEDNEHFRMLVANLSYSDYLGSLALGRVLSSQVSVGDTLYRHGITESGEPKLEKFQCTKILAYTGTKQEEVPTLYAGDIAMIAGTDNYEIGDTIACEGAEALPRIKVEEPTMRMIFSINTSPFSGKEGKAIQSRELRERLLKEVRENVALRLEDSDSADQIFLLGRGELQFGIIIEKMRREGLEFMVGRPQVLIQKDEHGNKREPFEKLSLDTPEDYAGDVTKLFQLRKGTLLSYENLAGNTDSPRVRLSFEIPSRGILGTHSAFKTATRGMGLMSSESLGYKDFVGLINSRGVGSLIADRTGKTTAYALFSVQQRGKLFVGEGIEVYEGMVIGEGNQDNDINVNPCKPKKLTNVRSVSSDGITILQGIKQMSLEQCIEWLDDDEWIEVTPQNIRLRKKILPANQRSVRRSDRMRDLGND